jgi:hypothetical protein
MRQEKEANIIAVLAEADGAVLQSPVAEALNTSVKLKCKNKQMKINLSWRKFVAPVL